LARREQERPKTIFDKVREIKRQQAEAIVELSDNDEPVPAYSMNIYSQKVNTGK
jgi:hypothetical protein